MNLTKSEQFSAEILLTKLSDLKYILKQIMFII